jgi:glycosyltransferase involved in cell wall biosynthesis
MSKKRVLLCGEASYTHSGFGVYTYELLSRLAKLNKYDIAEFGSFGQINHPGDKIIKWKYYANAVRGGDPRENEYKSSKANQFGAWRFNKVLLDFKPDVVISNRDMFMMGFEWMSPLRKYFHWCICPSIDSLNIREEWVHVNQQADSILTYTDFARDCLINEIPSLKTVCDVAYPGATECFKPILQKDQHKEGLGINPEFYIIGTVMRNQKRKLFLDLFEAFQNLLQKTQDIPKLKNKVFLYCHTSFPDLLFWNIPKYLKRLGIGNHVFFTYFCQKCKKFFVTKWKDAKTFCAHCKEYEAVLPNVGSGTTREQLAEIYNLFDIYVQYATAGATEFPILEAAHCNVPIAATYYSGMETIVDKLNGIPVDVKRMFWEIEMDCPRALPDNDKLVESLLDYLRLPRQMQRLKGFNTGELARKFFTWDKNAETWEKHLDSIELNGLQGQWSTKTQIPPQNLDIPNNLSNKDFINYAFDNIAGRPEFKNNQMSLSMQMGLDYGLTATHGQIQPYNRNNVIDFCKHLYQELHIYENARMGNLQVPEEDFISYAHIKDMLNNIHG